MSISRKKAWEYAEKVLARPGRDKQVVLRNGKQGITLLCEGRVLTRCYNTNVGAQAAPLMAQALGVDLPPLGSEVKVEVPSGVIFRAISISSFDLRRPEVLPLVERYLEEADFQRRRASGPVV